MDSITTKSITGFERYAFADSITVTGEFKSLTTFTYEATSITDGCWPDCDLYKRDEDIYLKVDKSYDSPSKDITYYKISDYNSVVKNCNFNFDSDYVKISSIDGMFDGCINAVFSSNLSILENSTVTSASKAFRNCVVAKLPSVDIGESKIKVCDRMFENCYSAELSGVQIPREATVFDGMFRNSKSAFFNDISIIPSGNGNYRELFSGCENGVFQNLEFGEDNKIDLDCGFMFYYCGNMDCGNLGFDKISKRITNAEYMFYSAGSNSSKTFDNGIFDFSSLTGCDYAFTDSNFSFGNSYFRFDGTGDINGNMSTTCKIKSIHRLFSGCKYCSDVSPVVIIGNLNGETFNLSSINSQLNKRLYGHYTEKLDNCIIDFSYLYEGSDFRTLDMRGVANNGVLSDIRKRCVQDFSSMCKDCKNLNNIIGYLPSCASTYDHMFSGCSHLSVNLPSLFKSQPYGWNDVSDLYDSFNRDGVFDSYSMTSINGMFEGCVNLYSKNDNFDIVGLFKTVEKNLKENGYYSSEYVLESIKDSFPPIMLATKNQISELGNVRYSINGISEKTGAIRYNSFVDDPAEIDSARNIEFASSYGLYSDYAKSAFGHGFYRYGGEFIGDSDKCFFIIFKPEKDEVTGKVVGFTSETTGYNVELRPHGWGEIFNTDSSKGYWSEFRYDKLYPGMVCNSDGTFIKFAYIGSYTRIYHEYRGNDNMGIYEYITEYVMPVTYFDGCEDSITPL